MEFVIQISQFLLSLSLLIVLHEFGHYLPAKLFKTKVEKFYLFFDPWAKRRTPSELESYREQKTVEYAAEGETFKPSFWDKLKPKSLSIIKKKIGETVYGIGWLPLGGYVKISGMIDESMDKEQMAKPPQPWEFRSKPAWQRLIIMLGGVTVNFILAYLIYVFASFAYGDTDITSESLKDGYWIENPVLVDLGFKTGDKVLAINDTNIINDSDIVSNIIGAQNITIDRQGEVSTIDLPEDFLGQLSSGKVRGLFKLRVPFMVGEVADSSLNKSAGLKEGDIIASINGQELKYFDQLESRVQGLEGQTVTASIIKADNSREEMQLKLDKNGKIGIMPARSIKRAEELGYVDVVRKEYAFGESFGVGWDKFTGQIKSYWEQLGVIFNPKTGAYKGVGGFKAIFDIFPSTWSWAAFWSLTAFLSIMLAILNLLPIPALDGGHVMFTLYEMISGRKPNQKFLERAQTVGFFILIALVLFANGNDIFKAITN
ncbi:RIP metalloprotease RseP [Winogradskyella sp. 3972H.M.0a.05]|uniref:RIP metalloprotease RseP n=1 Tax=Winogradskyella sp. 3972H.M.0a.05 TaxID=2950277 RepID=UPI003392CEC7